jgi:ketosteroid isomerase-like protein
LVWSEQRDELAQRFFAAAEQGDLAGLEALLASEVQLTGDGGC